MKKYVFKSYSPLLPQLFAQEKARILAHFKHDLDIQHIGSTAIPGVGGKGIIDSAIAVEKKEMSAVCEKLESLGYEFRPSHSTQDRLYLIIDLPDPEEEVRRYHMHVTHPESTDWKNFLLFRNYLRNHPHDALEYSRLKESAAQSANGEGSKYRDLKAPFFKKILNT